MSEWDAKDYHKNSANQQTWARELIALLELKGDERILDIGCGDGKVTAEIAYYVPNGSVLGIDLSEQMIGFAQKEFPPSDFPNLTFQSGDAKKLIFQQEFDVIVSFSCLHWVIDHIPVIEGIKKSLKPSGRILLTFPGKRDPGRIMSVLEEVIYSERWSKFFQEFTWPFGYYEPDEYQDYLERVGLKALRVESVTTELIQSGKEGVMAMIRATWLSFTCRIPSALRQDFIDELANKYVEIHPPDSMGLVHLPLTRLEVDAIKV